MARFLVFGVLLLPLVEIAVMIKVGQTIGLWPTLGLLVGAGVLGTALIRWQGFGAISRLRTSVAEGVMPGRAMADAMLIGLAAIFLLIPGFLSDLVALALLLPPVRALILAALGRRVRVVETRYEDHTHQAPPRGVIELDPEDYRRE